MYIQIKSQFCACRGIWMVSLCAKLSFDWSLESQLEQIDAAILRPHTLRETVPRNPTGQDPIRPQLKDLVSKCQRNVSPVIPGMVWRLVAT